MTARVWNVPLVEVALPVPDTEPLTYRLLKPQYEAATVGRIVQVPVKSRRLQGVIVQARRGKPIPGLKSVSFIRTDIPPLPNSLLKFTHWISDYYLCSWGEALKAALPSGLLSPARKLVMLATSSDEARSWDNIDSRWLRVVTILQEAGPKTIPALQTEIGVRSLRATISAMSKAGLVEVRDVVDTVAAPKFVKWYRLTDEAKAEGSANWVESLGRALKQIRIMEALSAAPDGLTWNDLVALTGAGRSSLTGLIRKGWIETALREDAYDFTDEDPPEIMPTADVFTSEQQQAARTISESVDGGEKQPILLFGCTGSGKTLLYIEAIRHVLSQGRGALVLVPEISLTPQTVRRFRGAFGNKVAVQHSGLTPSDRATLWRKIFEGKYPVVVGARSAVFSPVPNLGVIIVDEEHSPTFKQFDPAPRYNARDAALMRARMEHAVVILGSATPSLESFHHAMEGKYLRVDLTKRADGVPMPEVSIVDRTEHHEEDPASRTFSYELLGEIAKHTAQGDQVILLQNRRGYSTFIRCLDCGDVTECTHCAISLTYHKMGHRLRCHYCGYSTPAPSVCAKCGSHRLDYAGTGTQRVEEELEVLLPDVKVVRMDLDTTTSRGSHRRILSAFEEGGYHVLVGTQMVAKGLDMPEVTLVGVISADTELFLPDFRAGERTFALLSQAAGRAGRRGKPGKVIVQTYHPQNAVLEPVINHNYRQFYDHEIEARRELDYPPFSRLAMIRFHGKIEREVLKCAERFAELLRDRSGPLDIMGPAPAAVVRAKDLFQYQILVKSPRDADPVGEKLRHAVSLTKQAYAAVPIPGKVSVVIDVDPMGFG
jgi:primosomal protein N' (replication factor Y)